MAETKAPSVPDLEYRDFSFRLQTAQSGSGRFVKAQLELTYRCNFRCVHCYTDPFNRPERIRNELSKAEVFEILERLQAEGILWLSLTGGDPLAHPDFLEIYRSAWDRGFLITLLTNGTLVTAELAEELEARPPFFVEVTLYGASNTTYERVTGLPSFDRAKTGIERMTARRIPLRLKATLLNLNLHDREAMEGLAALWGLTLQKSGILYPRLDGDCRPLAYRLKPEEVLALEVEDGEGGASCAVFSPAGALSSGEVPPDLYRCGCGKTHLHIDPYGKVSACTWSRRGAFDFREGPLQVRMAGLGQAIRRERYQEESSCQRCQAFLFCEKKPEMALFEKGNAQEPIDYFCEIAFGKLQSRDKRSALRDKR